MLDTDEDIERVESEDEELSDGEADEEWQDIGEGDSPETIKLLMPSRMKPGALRRSGLQQLERQEAQLRVGQMNDALQGLRLALGEKALLLRTSVRNNKSQRRVGRAWAGVNKEEAKVQKNLRAYNRGRNAVIRLDAANHLLERYKAIRKEDLTMSGDITEENRIGQRNENLAWFWRIGGDGMEGEDSPRMKECK